MLTFFLALFPKYDPNGMKLVKKQLARITTLDKWICVFYTIWKLNRVLQYMTEIKSQFSVNETLYFDNIHIAWKSAARLPMWTSWVFAFTHSIRGLNARKNKTHINTHGTKSK